jgi:hypothetical protein
MNQTNTLAETWKLFKQKNGQIRYEQTTYQILSNLSPKQICAAGILEDRGGAVMDNDLEYCKNDECDLCWDFNMIHTAGIYREEYEMNMCDDCLEATECNS